MPSAECVFQILMVDARGQTLQISIVARTLDRPNVIASGSHPGNRWKTGHQHLWGLLPSGGPECLRGVTIDRKITQHVIDMPITVSSLVRTAHTFLEHIAYKEAYYVLEAFALESRCYGCVED